MKEVHRDQSPEVIIQGTVLSLTLEAKYSKIGMQHADGDFNGDGAISLPDFTLLQTNFGRTADGFNAPTPEESAALAAFAASVPEPHALVWLGLSALLCARRRRSLQCGK